MGPFVDLSQAAPGSAPHPELRQRMAAAAGAADTARYGPIVGDGALRDVYARHQSAVYGGEINAADVAITAGCNLAFAMAAMATARAGDNVILPSPWYFNHKSALDMLGVKTRRLACDPAQGFVPDPEQAERLITHRTRALVLVTPNNPTGAIVPPGTIRAFHDLCQRRGIALILDETYRDFLPPGQARAHDEFQRPDWRDSLIQLYSFSKAYAIPGHRLGALVAGPRIQAQVETLLDTFQICAARAGQAALVWGIPSLDRWREENRVEIYARAEAFRAEVAAVPGWRIDSIGAYFACLRHPFAGKRSEDVAEGLAKRCGLLVLPGSWFGPGQERHLRVAFANADVAAIAGLRARFRALSM